MRASNMGGNKTKKMKNVQANDSQLTSTGTANLICARLQLRSDMHFGFTHQMLQWLHIRLLQRLLQILRMGADINSFHFGYKP